MNTYDFLIGIDIGTTNIKCLAVNPDGRCVFSAKAPSGSIYRKIKSTGRDGCIATREILDAERLWKAVTGVCRIVAGKIKDEHPDGRILGLGVASVGCRGLLFDKKGHQIIGGTYYERSSLFEKIRHAYSDEEYFVKTGYPFESGNPAFEIACILEYDPGMASRINALMSVSDYINYRLTGEIVQEYSTACSWGIWDIGSGAWLQDISDYFDSVGFDRSIFGQPVHGGTMVGSVHRQASEATGFPEGVKVFAAGHDYLCAAYATGCVNEGRILNVLGTYEMVASFHGHALNNPEYSRKRTIIDHHVYPGRFSFAVENSCACQTEWLKKIVKSDWDNTFKSLETIPPAFSKSGGRELFIPGIFTPSFPNWMPGATGGYLGLTAGTDTVSLLRATIEGLCFFSKGMFEYQHELAANRNSQIIVTGGGSRSRFWLQAKADILGMTLSAPRIHEATATGAALIAGTGAKVYSGHDEAVRLTNSWDKDIFVPDDERKQFYEDIYDS